MNLGLLVLSASCCTKIVLMLQWPPLLGLTDRPLTSENENPDDAAHAWEHDRDSACSVFTATVLGESFLDRAFVPTNLESSSVPMTMTMIKALVISFLATSASAFVVKSNIKSLQHAVTTPTSLNMAGGPTINDKVSKESFCCRWWTAKNAQALLLSST